MRDDFMKKKLIVLIDSGDTLIDESTQVFDDRGIVLDAEFIGGALELLSYLRDENFRICLVADGEMESFHNVYGKKGLASVFEGWVISEAVGAQKPDRAMFDAAFHSLGLSDRDKGRVIMIGNNLKKDIAGANRYGIMSLWMNWSPRYFQSIESSDWQPGFSAGNPHEVIQILKRIEASL